MAETEEGALEITDKVEREDTSGRLKLELEFPKDWESYTPFLSTEIKVDTEGAVHSRYYRKPQKKSITLHYKSHQPLTTKTEVAKNFYKTAKEVSNSPENVTRAVNIIDDLLRKNGYDNPRRIDQNGKKKKKKKKHRDGQDKVSLVLPYVSEDLCNKIKEQIRRQKLPIKATFIHGRKLKNIFTNSRPFDRVQCVVGRGCDICPNMEHGGCAQTDCVYCVMCRLCLENYGGETSRANHYRMMEHRSAAANPPAYPENAIGKHYL